ncbi:MAG: hypothetical protein GEV28_13175 [Actinophytocola sp.]|uniref:acyl carrier protein n=1 Tax=Actinophytocola sp. TaxID=1872138 RepID=UPI00132C633D|nr:acyl carrier protein [Actinophytocola sp.]MPZ81291.1 hypothetical protein [Actinophytocola sp.]
MFQDDVTFRLLKFIQENLRPDDMTDDITGTSRLFELGVLDSLRTARLLNFIRDELGATVPPLMIEYRNFQDVVGIAAMVQSLITEAEDGGVRHDS